MRRTAILEGVRMMRFLDVFGRCERRELSRLEAAELLGVNERTLRRWCRRFEAEGEAGLVTSPFVTTRKQLESEIHCVSKTDDTSEKVASSSKRFQSHQGCLAGKMLSEDQWLDCMSSAAAGSYSGMIGVFHHYPTFLRHQAS
jgi:transposase-like protein